MQPQNTVAALTLIESTLVTSIVLLAISFVLPNNERSAVYRTLLVAVSFVLQASCIGTVWVSEGRSAESLFLLVITIVTFAIVVGATIHRTAGRGKRQ